MEVSVGKRWSKQAENKWITVQRSHVVLYCCLSSITSCVVWSLDRWRYYTGEVPGHYSMSICFRITRWSAAGYVLFSVMSDCYASCIFRNHSAGGYALNVHSTGYLDIICTHTYWVVSTCVTGEDCGTCWITTPVSMFSMHGLHLLQVGPSALDNKLEQVSPTRWYLSF